mgnify:CR=1 FL=1
MTKDMMAKALSDFFAKEGVEKMDLTTLLTVLVVVIVF